MKQTAVKTSEDPFAGESEASAPYRVHADRAEAEYPNLARLFRALALAERAHTARHRQAEASAQATKDDLEHADANEGSDALQVEQVQLSLYERAKAAVNSGRDLSGSTLQVCAGCGWTAEGAAPEECPLCGAKKERFRAF